jgi:uncharacterized membrane protein
VTLNDWILALHVLSACALVGALTIFSILIAAQWNETSAAAIASVARIGLVGTILIAVGTAGTLLFGLWLTFSVEGYRLWDAWVLIALVLWAAGAELGRRAGRAYGAAAAQAGKLAATEGGEPADVRALARPAQAHWYHLAACVAAVLVLVDMIWKPGA